MEGDLASILETVADLEAVPAAVGAELAGHKSPRELVVVPAVQRSPAGKADLRRAGRVARGEA